MSVLHLAAENGFDDIVRLLLARKDINVNIQTIFNKIFFYKILNFFVNLVSNSFLVKWSFI